MRSRLPLVLLSFVVGVVLTGVVGVVAGTALVRDMLARESRVRLDPIGVGAHDRVASIEGAIVIAGDSRFASLTTPTTIEGIPVVTIAVGGTTAAQTTARLDDLLDSGPPRLVVIQSGINDLKSAAYGLDASSLIEGVVDHLLEVVSSIRGSGGSVVVTAILPPGSPGGARRLIWDPDLADHVERTNDLLEAGLHPNEWYEWTDPLTFADALHFDDETNARLSSSLVDLIRARVKE